MPSHRKVGWALALIGLVLSGTVVAYAHFGMVIPSTDIVTAEAKKEVALEVMFAHPMEGHTMEMAKPAQFGVMVGGRKYDLLDTLQAKKVKGHTGYETSYKIRRPGDHVFYLEPAPYWEPAEQCMIIHSTKVVVNALGLEEGWDQDVGLKAEILPLVRPYGLWTGNVFRGMVKKDGKAVPHAEVEVEYYNKEGKVQWPSDPFITQVVKADAQGIFSYAMPRAGWWGFAALMEGDELLKNPEGKDVPVEIGAVMWVHTVDMK